MENSQELIAEFHDSNHELRSHIKRALGHLTVPYPSLSTLPSSSTSKLMSDATHSPEHAAVVEENTNPLLIPPRTTPPNAPISSVRTLEQDAAIQEHFAGFLRICEDGSTNVAGIRFPHPDEPTPSELNDSNQENIPPAPTVPHPNPPVQTPSPLGRTRHSSHSLTTSLPTKPSWPPSLECITTSTVATHTSNRSKRSFKLAELSDTKARPARMTKLWHSSQDSIKYDDWNLDLSRLPLRHQHPLTSPSQHSVYRATCKSQPVPRPPVPESALWPADWLRPSNALPEDSGVQGLKLTVWECEYRLFRRGFANELNCCLLARQEELKRRLP